MEELGQLSILSLLSAPVFVALLLVEVAWARARGHRFHRLRETVASLACGAGEQAVALSIAIPLMAVYAVATRFAPVTWPVGSVWTWVGAAIAIDFLYYGFHRAGHRVGFIWAIHVVHHQARDFNVSVALRNSFFGKVVQLFFILPLAFLGVPLVVMVTLKTAMNFYMFWQHTQAFGPRPWLERVFVTPSVHRVHHALNPRYVNHNYGGILTIWDRLFGTWQAEDEPCRFEDVPDHPGFDPVQANVVGWEALARRVRAAPTRGAALAVVFGPPDDASLREVAAAAPERAGPGRGLQVYAYAQMAAALTGLAVGHSHGPMLTGAATVGVLAGLSVPTGLLDGRAWAGVGERVRLVGLLAAAVGLMVGLGPPAAPVAAAITLWSLASVGALTAITA